MGREDHWPAGTRNVNMTQTDAAPPGLTIIVLTRNRRELLRGCIESLIAQEDPGIPLEFIVVDDGSQDGTAGLVRSQWRYISQAHRGIAAARNTGIRNSRTGWLAIVADDYLLPADYARAVALFFQGYPQAQVVRFKVVAEGGGFLSRVLHAYQEASVIRRLAGRGPGSGRSGIWRRRRVEERITADHGLEAAGAAAFRREVFLRVGGFDETFPRGEDTDLTRRLHAAGIAVYYSPHLLVRHRSDPRLADALKNAFISGRASWRLSAPTRRPSPGIPYIVLLGLRSAFLSLYWSCWRAWQAGTTARFILYWPVLLLLETSTRAGFFSGCLRSRKKTPDALAGGVRP
jgi:GT2 family glycosyltransferase